MNCFWQDGIEFMSKDFRDDFYIVGLEPPFILTVR